MKKKLSKRLSLSKQTLAQLSTPDLARVVAGRMMQSRITECVGDCTGNCATLDNC